MTTWSDGFVDAIRAITDATAPLVRLERPTGKISVRELARCHRAVFAGGEDIAAASVRLRQSLEGGLIRLDELAAEKLFLLEQETERALQSSDCENGEANGGLVLAADFHQFSNLQLRGVHGELNYLLGGVESLPPTHWVRDLLAPSGWYQSNSQPFLVLGLMRNISGGMVRRPYYLAEECVAVTRRLRREQAEKEETYLREQQQADEAARREWLTSPQGRLATLERENREMKERLASLEG